MCLFNSIFFHYRSVEKIIDEQGIIRNAYKYDVFGQIVQKSEQLRNIFKYNGIFGIIHDDELGNTYMMRARHYDAELGRFISLDPTGVNA